MTDIGMSDALAFVASFVAGGLVGLLFFGGLWLTVSGMSRARHPALRMLVSLLLRLGLVLGASYLLIRYGAWQQALFAAIGFALTRYIVIRSARSRQLQEESDG